MFPFFITNFTTIQQDLVNWSLQGYITVFGMFFWPLIFTAIAGYVYLKQQSAVAAAVFILIVMAAFGDAMLGVETWAMLLHILVALAITALVLIFISKRRG